MDIDLIPNYTQKVEINTKLADMSLIPQFTTAGSFGPTLEQFHNNPSRFLSNITQTREELHATRAHNEELQRENNELRNQLTWLYVQHSINTSLTARTMDDEIAEWQEVVITDNKSYQSNYASAEEILDENNNITSLVEPAIPPAFNFPTITFRIEVVTTNAERGSVLREPDFGTQVHILEPAVQSPDVINVDISKLISIHREDSTSSLQELCPPFSDSETEAIKLEASSSEAVQSKASITEAMPSKASTTEAVKSKVSITETMQSKASNTEATAPNHEMFGCSAKEVTFDTQEPTRFEPTASTESLLYPKLSDDDETEEPVTPESTMPPPVIKSTTGIVRQVPSLTLGKSKAKGGKKQAKKPSMLKNMWGAKNGAGCMTAAAPITGLQQHQTKKVVLKKKQTPEPSLTLTPGILPISQKDTEDKNKVSPGYNPFLDE